MDGKRCFDYALMERKLFCRDVMTKLVTHREGISELYVRAHVVQFESVFQQRAFRDWKTNLDRFVTQPKTCWSNYHQCDSAMLKFLPG
jgi:hypothetical protein